MTAAAPMAAPVGALVHCWPCRQTRRQQWPREGPPTLLCPAVARRVGWRRQGAARGRGAASAWRTDGARTTHGRQTRRRRGRYPRGRRKLGCAGLVCRRRRHETATRGRWGDPQRGATPYWQRAGTRACAGGGVCGTPPGGAGGPPAGAAEVHPPRRPVGRARGAPSRRNEPVADTGGGGARKKKKKSPRGKGRYAGGDGKEESTQSKHNARPHPSPPGGSLIEGGGHQSNSERTANK